MCYSIGVYKAAIADSCLKDYKLGLRKNVKVLANYLAMKRRYLRSFFVTQATPPFSD